MRKLFLLALSGTLLLQINACKKGSGLKTPGGHLVTIHTSNAGPKINYGDQVTISVDTWLKDSLVSSTARDMGGPREVTIPPKAQMPEKVPAVFEALLMLVKGDSATVIQTIDSAMAKNMPPMFADAKQIRFEVKVVDVLDSLGIVKKNEERMAKAKEMAAQGPAVLENLKSMIAEYKAGKLANLQKTGSGLEYVVLEKGTGAQLKKGERVPTNYYGVKLSDGTAFDNSYDRGGPADFMIGQMIPGFDEGLLLLTHGSKAVFFIPWKLGYGEQGIPNGPIGPKSDLVFYVNVQ